ncbi:Unannotated [Lentimonas sp. CC4]|nr:Unannotated [Lentimonas sp. CC4]CAA6684847.1 Unannotated [Lentimonas sp. CC6]CAA7076798.1 Unannotated [Lentimonas sp. CC4]CAA7170804.1 Unannotated [Lentimonas sp. CC21]CAA7179634.1 Unannotated [Lentimonas sp. CC8]
MSVTHRVSHWSERLAIVGCCMLVIGLIRLTLWKENELFWLNLGGYPIWLRDSVHFLYYPYLFFTVTTLCVVSRSVLGRFIHELIYHKVWILLLVAWILFFSNCGLLIANNVINLWIGQPLHHHDAIDSL